MAIFNIAAPISPVAGILNDLSGLAASNWNIVECTYISNLTLAKTLPPRAAPAPVKFIAFKPGPNDYNASMMSITDIIGRRKVVYRFAYVDGQTTDDLGRKGEENNLDVIIWGANYVNGLNAFLKELNQPGAGILTHPVRGRLPVTPTDGEILHESASRKAIILRIKFIEHTFTISQLAAAAPNKVSTFKSALQAAMGAVAAVNNIAIGIQSNIFAIRGFATQISNALTAYSTGFTALLQSLSASFSTDSNTDLPGLLPVSQGGTATGSGNTAQTNFPVANSVQDPFLPVANASTNSPISSLTPTQATNAVNTLRDQAQAIISQLETSTVIEPVNQQTDGSLYFHDEILQLKVSSNQMLSVLQAALANSQSALVNFTTPRDMSVREIAFACGLDVNLSYYIELQNPWILSSNLVPQGTSLQVPVS
jgi:prophage DNA circulation protein